MSTRTLSSKKELVQFSVVDLSDDSVRSSNSSATEKQELDIADIPNGGIVAWLQVLGAFFLWFNTWSVVARVVALL